MTILDLIDAYKAALPPDDLEALGELIEVVEFYSHKDAQGPGLKFEVARVIARSRDREQLARYFSGL